MFRRYTNLYQQCTTATIVPFHAKLANNDMYNKPANTTSIPLTHSATHSIVHVDSIELGLARHTCRSAADITITMADTVRATRALLAPVWQIQLARAPYLHHLIQRPPVTQHIVAGLAAVRVVGRPHRTSGGVRRVVASLGLVAARVEGVEEAQKEEGD